MPSAPAITLESSPDANDVALIARGMRDHALAQIAGDESPPFACFAREGRSIVGGAVGRIIKGRMFVELLWVEEARRDEGLGSSLLSALEQHARTRGLHIFNSRDESRGAKLVGPIALFLGRQQFVAPRAS